MPKLSSLEGILWFLTTLLTVLLLLRLLWTRLSSVYPAFAWFLVFGFARSIIGAASQLSQKQYYWYYIVTEAILLFFYILMTLEVYTLVLQKYPGIQALSRWMLSGALIGAMTLAMASMYPEMMAKAKLTEYDLLGVAERGILSGLVLLILLVTLFLSWFPISLPRQIALHSILFAAFFLLKGGARLAQNYSQNLLGRPLNLALFSLACCCLLGWIFVLKPMEENPATLKMGKWNRTDENRLLGQLQEINETLSGKRHHTGE